MSQNNATAAHILQDAKQLGFGELHFKHDPSTDLCAIIAIHSTSRGPALGGCRCIEYDNIHDAIIDALRLARGMTYKNAISDLPIGGGKAVLMRPKHIADPQAYFTAFGQFVNDLGGRYITAMDSGTSITDMDIIAQTTKYLASSSEGDGDPSPHTAQGVLCGIQACVEYKLKKESLKDIHIAIQGLGHVGYVLAQLLHARGARLTVSDVDAAAAQRCANEFNASVVEPDDIYQVACDVFSPCALGAILNDETIPLIKAPIIAGAANNQLETPEHGIALHQRGILYAPDYLINAGGVIYAATRYTEGTHITHEHIHKKIHHIYTQLLEIFQRAEREHQAPSVIVDKIAEENF